MLCYISCIRTGPSNMRFLLHSKSILSNQILEPETTTGWNPHKKYNTDDLEEEKKDSIPKKEEESKWSSGSHS